MGLEVIGAGFGRTGTASLKAALEILGYDKCHHMFEVIASLKQVDYWYAIARGDQPDWDAVFEGFRSCVDFPASLYYRQLADEYPEAKVVLSLRSPDSWYSSARETIYTMSQLITSWLRIIPRLRKLSYLVQTSIWKGKFGGRFEDRETAIGVFKQHIEEVRAAIPPERLLVMEVKEGWGPLCQFLGEEIPDVPFPRVNDTAEFHQRIRLVKAVLALPWVFAFAGLAWACWHYLA